MILEVVSYMFGVDGVKSWLRKLFLLSPQLNWLHLLWPWFQNVILDLFVHFFITFIRLRFQSTP